MFIPIYYAKYLKYTYIIKVRARQAMDILQPRVVIMYNTLSCFFVI